MPPSDSQVPPSDSSAAVSRGMQTQLANRASDLAGGAVGIGWKIGFDTPAIQEHFGLSDAVVGYLTDTRVVGPGAGISLAGCVAPAVEVELAVRVGDDGGIAGLGPALELVDLDVSFDDIEPVLAGNICHRGVVFGPDVPGADPLAMTATVRKDGAVVAEGRLTKDPAVTVAFVRSFLATHGGELEPGQRIICGSVVPPVAVTPGDALDVSFGPFGDLQIRFVPSGSPDMLAPREEVGIFGVGRKEAPDGSGHVGPLRTCERLDKDEDPRRGAGARCSEQL